MVLFAWTTHTTKTNETKQWQEAIMTFTTDPNRTYPAFNGKVPEMYHRPAGTGKETEFYLNLVLPPFLLSGDENTWAKHVTQYVAENKITPPTVTIPRKGSIKTDPRFMNKPIGTAALAFILRRLSKMPDTDEMQVNDVTNVIGEVLGTSPLQYHNGRGQEVLIELSDPRQARRELYYVHIAERLRLVYMRLRKTHPHMSVRFEHNNAIILLDQCYHWKKEVMLDRIQRAYLEAVYRFLSRVDWHGNAEEKEAV